MAKKKEVKVVKTLENKIQENNIELIRALASGLNTAILTRQALEHSMVVMHETAKLCKEAGNGMKVNSKRYSYLTGKVNDLDKVIIPLIKTLEKTLGVENLQRNLDDVTEIYSDLYQCVEVEKKEEELVK